MPRNGHNGRNGSVIEETLSSSIEKEQAHALVTQNDIRKGRTQLLQMQLKLCKYCV